MTKRLKALFLLGLQLVIHVISRLWRRRSGDKVFRQNFEPEGLLALTAADRVLMEGWQRCTGCGLCEVVCPDLRLVVAGRHVGPSLWATAYPRDFTALGDFGDAATTILQSGEGLRAGESICPEEVPLMDIVGFLERHGQAVQSAKTQAPRPPHTTKTPLQNMSASAGVFSFLFLFSVLSALGVAGCGKGSSGGSTEQDATTEQVNPFQSATQQTDDLPDPLAASEATQMPGNLLTPDPTPWRHPAAVDGGTLRRGVGYVPLEFNWLTNNTTAVHDINAYVVETLAMRHQKDPSKWAPLLARAITVSEDRRVFTVHLRRGVMWHRPAPQALEENRKLPTGAEPIALTARDFEFAFRMLKDVRVSRAAPARSWYTMCERLRVLDDYTFELHWDQPGLAAYLGTMTLQPLPEHIYAFDSSGERYHNPAAMLDAHWYVWPIGTGPYQTEVMDRDAGQFLMLGRNPLYHNTKPAIAALSYEGVDQESIVERFQQGLLDVVELSPAQYREMVLSAPIGSAFRTGELRLATYRDLGFSYIGWNMRQGPTTDKKVRQALTLGMNRERIARELSQGKARVAVGPFPSISPDSDPSIKPWPFDLPMAARLLDEAGWKDTDGDGFRDRVNEYGESEVLEVGVLFGSAPGDFWTRAIDMYAHDLSLIGVRLVPENAYNSDDNQEARIDTFDFGGFVNGWGMDWENDLFQVWHSSQADIPAGSNRIGIENDTLDALIDAVRVEVDPAQRLLLQHQIHRLIHDEQPYTFVVEDEVILAYSDRLQGVQFQTLRPHDLSLTWWIEGGP